MPFDENEKEPKVNKTGLKKVSSTSSMFDNNSSNKKPSYEEFHQKAESINNKINSHAENIAELAVKFSKLLKDQTVPSNKNPIAKSLEKELISEMSSMASLIDNDENEKLGVGSLAWITLLLNTSLYQRDRINTLEHEINVLKKSLKTEVSAIDVEIKSIESDIKVIKKNVNKD